jgi:hypothetical protein
MKLHIFCGKKTTKMVGKLTELKKEYINYGNTYTLGTYI